MPLDPIVDNFGERLGFAARPDLGGALEGLNWTAAERNSMPYTSAQTQRHQPPNPNHNVGQAVG